MMKVGNENFADFDEHIFNHYETSGVAGMQNFVKGLYILILSLY